MAKKSKDGKSSKAGPPAGSKAGPKIGLIMGSDSDLRVMKDAAALLEAFGIPHEVRVVSAHRTPEAMLSYAREAAGRGLCAIIAGAGGAAHLPGMVAACTTLPVIGVPISLHRLDGMDSLLSIAQMPKGVPVGAMAIDGAVNAALYAARLLAVTEPGVRAKLEKFAATQAEKVATANRNLKG